MLGKSVATVRQLEGVLLHPTEDGKGIWRFDADEVAQLSASVRDGSVNLWAALRGSDLAGQGHAEEPCRGCAELKARLHSLEGALATLRQKHAAEIQVLTSEHAAERQRAERATRQLEGDAAALLAEINELLR